MTFVQNINCIVFSVILACGVLENICKSRNIPLVDEIPVVLADNRQDNQQYIGPEEGLPYREYICRTYF